ncbi:ywqF, partial [Symbiodinium microadriaticum]
MKVTVIGTGYVGLVTGTVFSIQGHDVTCVDTNREKIDGLRRGVLPIYEPGLAELVETGIANCCLSFSTDAAAASEDADVIFLAVGTPQSESGAADLSYLKAAAESIADSAKKGAVVVIKSTVPVGTNRQIAQLLAEKSGRAIDVASNPEFLKEGTAIDDCLNPDRIILGVRNKRVAFVLQRLYT